MLRRMDKFGMPELRVVCVYCDGICTLYASDSIFHRGRHYRSCWACLECNAWVKAVDGLPTGTVANVWDRMGRDYLNSLINEMTEYRRKGKGKGESFREARKVCIEWLFDRAGIGSAKWKVSQLNGKVLSRTLELAKKYVREYRECQSDTTA